MPFYPLFVLLHVGAGIIALATFWLAAALRKGSPAHRLSGKVYLCAMAVIIATGFPLVVQRLVEEQTVTAAFLGYLLVITATGVWVSWRAIRDKQDVERFTGPVYVALAVLSLVSGVGVLALGLQVGAPLLIGFSSVGLLAGVGMLRKRQRRVQLAQRPRWWLAEHYTGMLGNFVATHIAFLSIGLPRLLPMLDGVVLSYASWFGPLLLAGLAKFWLDRRWAPRPRQASAPVGQPSPVPRL
ncbi:hypothetical protein [Lysobacter sp. D1-1-M9]|uniref:hypothetical protein n=1 Tax=Novilysobacter longmucuonensis TaxID=3098603 RepID=UPI002FCC9E4B